MTVVDPEFDAEIVGGLDMIMKGACHVRAIFRHDRSEPVLVRTWCRSLQPKQFAEFVRLETFIRGNIPLPRHGSGVLER